MKNLFPADVKHGFQKVESKKIKKLVETDHKMTILAAKFVFTINNPLPNNKILDWSKLKAFADVELDYKNGNLFWEG